METESEFTRKEKTGPEAEVKCRNEEDVNETFFGKSGYFDLSLIVEGRKIYVCRAVLYVASPVFQSMFNMDFKEKVLQEIELPGKSYADFVEFLQCFYPDKLKRITADNVYRILPYVNEYRVKALEQRCEELMIRLALDKYSADDVEIYKHLQLSETYSLEELKCTCISLASDLSVAEMDKGSSVYDVSDKSILQIRYLALKRKELDQKDDMDIFKLKKKQHYGGTKQLNAGLFIQSISQGCDEETLRNFMKVNENSKCSELLRAKRVCLRFFTNDEEALSNIAKYLNAKPHAEFANIKDELELLPEAVKQSLTITKRMDFGL